MTIILDGTKGTTTPGLYSSTTFTGTYADGIVVDYTTGMGRISVGTSDGLAFYNAGVANTELMRLDSSGYLGIGTNAPGIKLDVNGGFRAQGQNVPTSGVGVEIVYNATGGFIYPYDRSASSFKDMIVDGANLRFQTGGSERARIDSSGNLLVGATSTSFPSSDAKTVSLTNAVQNALFVNVNAASSTAKSAIAVRKYDNNNTTSQIYIDLQYNQGLSGAGGIQGNGASGAQFYSSSDARLKENIVELEPQLANILALKPSKFDYIDGPKDCTGFIAQEMEQVYPDAVGETPDGYKTIGGISIMETRLIKAIQEQQAIIEQLRADVAQLKGKA